MTTLSEEANISICIPTFNRSDLLRKTLSSVSKQTVKPFEVLVVDNCSQDDTEAVAKSFPGVRYCKNERNLGLAGNWNQCVKLSKGEFITILHSDDLIAPRWYEEMSGVIAEHKGAGIGVYFLPSFTIDLEETAKIVYFSFYHSTILSAGESIEILWKRDMCGLPASGGIVFRKDVFNEIGLYDESLTTETDTLTVLRVLNRYPVYYYKKLLYAYRIHPFQTFDKEKASKSAEKKLSVLKNHLRILKNFYDNELDVRYRKPFFFKRAIYMYMAIGLCNFLLLKPKLAKRYFESIREILPDLRFTTGDYFRLLSVIVHYGYILPWGRFSAFPIRNIAKSWVEQR